MSRDLPAKTESTDTPARLLRAASELVGGHDQLARRLNMSSVLLRRYMSGRDELPPPLLLRTVDLLLEEREARAAAPGKPALSQAGEAAASGGE